jgi:hypothetical protein
VRACPTHRCVNGSRSPTKTFAAAAPTTPNSPSNPKLHGQLRAAELREHGRVADTVHDMNNLVTPEEDQNQ